VALPLSHFCRQQFRQILQRRTKHVVVVVVEMDAINIVIISPIF
jgi:hypothetical protein